MGILIADGGSTKVSWRLVEGNDVKSSETAGINPALMTVDDISSVLESCVFSSDKEVGRIFYYGAGVIAGEPVERLTTAFGRIWPSAELSAESDLLAAARALCGHNAGIACILGTGSNSCFYDGTKVVGNVKSGGFILGDEASGAYFGKRLVSDYIKGLLPPFIENEFRKRYRLNYASIVQKVYKEPMPNAFLASFSPFISEFINQPYMTTLVKSGFEEFLRKNVTAYEYRRYPVNFTGSIAEIYKDILSKCVGACGMRMGKVLKTPIEGLVEYHVQD